MQVTFGVTGIVLLDCLADELECDTFFKAAPLFGDLERTPVNRALQGDFTNCGRESGSVGRVTPVSHIFRSFASGVLDLQL